MRAVIPVVLVTAVLLAGCAPSPADPEPDSADANATGPQPPGAVDSDDCLVGTWNLDVPAYASESEAYLVGLGIPLDDFAMDGAGKLTLTTDGLASVDIDVRTAATLVAGDQLIPIDVPSSYTATGDWSRTGDDTAQFDNWAKVTEEEGIPPEIDLPSFDATQLADVQARCSSNELSLAAPGAPIGSNWYR